MTPSEPAAAPTDGELPKVDTPVVPEAYTFTPPEGYTVDKALTDAVTPVFKELGLTQEQASKLFDIQAAHQIELAKKIDTAVADTRKSWQDAVTADPVMGPNLDKIKTDVGRAMQHIPTEVATKFKAALDWTGVGDNPDVVRGIWELTKLVNEGKPVSGGGPSPLGQSSTGQPARPSAAQALYPRNP